MYVSDPSCKLTPEDAALVHDIFTRFYKDAWIAWENNKYNVRNGECYDDGAYAHGLADAVAILLRQLDMPEYQMGLRIDTDWLRGVDMEHWLK